MEVKIVEKKNRVLFNCQKCNCVFEKYVSKCDGVKCPLCGCEKHRITHLNKVIR